MKTLTRPADVASALADPRLAVPSAPGGAFPGSLGWLRATVSRFSNGDTHQHRRGLATAELARLDPAELRRQSHARAASAAARTVPVDVLAAALGADDRATAAVVTVAKSYLTGTADAATDRAVALLVDLFGGTADEPTAARIALLVQACEATGGLIDRALRAPHDVPVDAALSSVLRDDPPVLLTRRVATEPVRIGGVELAAGDEVRLDLAAAGLPFGGGHRPCPGQAHALALAAGVVEAVRMAPQPGHREGHGDERAVRSRPPRAARRGDDCVS